MRLRVLWVGFRRVWVRGVARCLGGSGRWGAGWLWRRILSGVPLVGSFGMWRRVLGWDLVRPGSESGFTGFRFRAVTRCPGRSGRWRVVWAVASGLSAIPLVGFFRGVASYPRSGLWWGRTLLLRRRAAAAAPGRVESRSDLLRRRLVTDVVEGGGGRESWRLPV